MSRKHYEALAQEIRLIPEFDIRLAAARAVIKACEMFNPRFNREIFYTACGL